METRGSESEKGDVVTEAGVRVMCSSDGGRGQQPRMQAASRNGQRTQLC